ncbi:restriction endonuclease subunit S [Alkalibacterium indicireducens]|uniref:Restriction endonuclease subunit S n=1 Tax=Alkalibacterium indicireducens TaxID=398758 RepID=A0ABN1BA69_9LACT
MTYNSIPISEGFEIISGGTPKRTVKSYWNGDIPWISIKDFNDEYRYLLNTEDYINNEGLRNSSTNILDKNDIIISARGTVGKINMIRKPMAFNQSCYGLRAREGIEAKYGYFAIKNSIRELQSHAYGSVFSTITKVTFDNIEIPKPKLSEQKVIGNILSSLDDKIENNNAIIANLEEQAQTIFKSWFIDFEPFKDEKFTDSELGRFPEGWKKISLENIATFKNGLAMQKFRPETEQDSLPVLKIKELRANKTDSSSDRCTVDIPKEVLIENGDIIFSWSGSLLVEVWTGGTAGLNQHLFKVSSNKYNKWFYYYWTKFFLNQFVAIARDRATTMGHIKRSHLKEAKVLIPDDVTLGEMDKVMDPIISKIINLGVQNKKLEELRDTLLPKLMSGEIQVEEAVETE